MVSQIIKPRIHFELILKFLWNVKVSDPTYRFKEIQEFKTIIFFKTKLGKIMHESKFQSLQIPYITLIETHH